jgi:hypothetical protein
MVDAQGVTVGTVAAQRVTKIDAIADSANSGGFVVLDGLVGPFIHSPTAEGGPKRQLFYVGRPNVWTRPPAEARENLKGNPDREIPPFPG